MNTATLDFWYEFASPYSYLSAMRIDDAATHMGVDVAWKPFLLGPVFRGLGFEDSPFNAQPLKRAYMWRDMERCSEAHNLPFIPPEPFPGNGLMAARLAILGCEQGWGAAFSKGVYSAYFGEGRDLSDQDVLLEILERTADGGAMTIWDQAQSQDNKDALRVQTERAIELGLFGAPTFMVGNEMFWGNDRLEAALTFARHNTKA